MGLCNVCKRLNLELFGITSGSPNLQNTMHIYTYVFSAYCHTNIILNSAHGEV